MVTPKTVKKRLALALGMVNRNSSVSSLSGPAIKHRPVLSDHVILTNSRYRAGITRVSLFGNDLGLGYSPPQ